MQQYIALTLLIEKDEPGYVAYCQELDVASSGATVEEATENISDAVEAYLNVLEKEGIREQIFKEKGIRMFPVRPTSVPCKERFVLKNGAFYHPYIKELHQLQVARA
jgi:predicted RNase H-like HicB family nuclease